MNKDSEVVFNPEQFAQMTASAIASYIRTNDRVAIVGLRLGVDRHIIRYETTEAWLTSKNPYSK
jgi:hypothetical protein